MAEDKDQRLDKLRRDLRKRGNQVSPDLRRIARAALGDTDKTLSHAKCIAALPEFVDAEIAGERVAEKFPLVKQHLDLCDECSEQYTALLEVTLAERSGEIPVPADMPAPDLSFLSSRRESNRLAKEWTPQMLTRLKSQLRDLVLINNVSLGGAFAKTATPKTEDGQTEDGALRWHIAEDDERNLIIHFGSHVLALEGVRIQLKAGGWKREVVLTRVAPDQVGAEIVLTEKERSKVLPRTRTPLIIEFVDVASR